MRLERKVSRQKQNLQGFNTQIFDYQQKPLDLNLEVKSYTDANGHLPFDVENESRCC